MYKMYKMPAGGFYLVNPVHPVEMFVPSSVGSGIPELHAAPLGLKMFSRHGVLYCKHGGPSGPDLGGGEGDITKDQLSSPMIL